MTRFRFIALTYCLIRLQSAQNRIYIKKGQVVNHDGITNADVYIEDGKVNVKILKNIYCM